MVRKMITRVIWLIPCLIPLPQLPYVLASPLANSTLGNSTEQILQMEKNGSVSTLDSIEAIIESSQNSGVLGRLAKCGATMQNMTEEQHQCVDNLAMGLEGLK
jgi:hypothetical protein